MMPISTARSIQPSGRRRRSVSALTPRTLEYAITTINATGITISQVWSSSGAQKTDR